MPVVPLEKPDLFVVARILERLWREDAPMLKTRLQMATNVNYDVFRRYVVWMSEKQLLRVEDSDDGHERLTLTPKGHEAYSHLVTWIIDVVRKG